MKVSLAIWETEKFDYFTLDCGLYRSRLLSIHSVRNSCTRRAPLIYALEIMVSPGMLIDRCGYTMKYINMIKENKPY